MINCKRAFSCKQVLVNSDLADSSLFMRTFKILKKQPRLFFRLSGISVSDFDDLAEKILPLWEAHNNQRLFRPHRQRAIGGGPSHKLSFEEMLLLCLIYYRIYTNGQKS